MHRRLGFQPCGRIILILASALPTTPKPMDRNVFESAKESAQHHPREIPSFAPSEGPLPVLPSVRAIRCNRIRRQACASEELNSRNSRKLREYRTPNRMTTSAPMSRTKVFQARQGSGSMKGTIPSDVVSALKQKHDDAIEWEIAAEDGKIIAKVRKAE